MSMNIRPTRRAGFSLIELLMAIFILGIGIISIASLFPAGIAQQRGAMDDQVGPLAGSHGDLVQRNGCRQQTAVGADLLEVISGRQGQRVHA